MAEGHNGRRLLIGFTLPIFVLIAIIVARTLLFSQAPEIAPIRTANPSVRADIAAAHLAEAIRFQTISRDTGPSPYGEIDRLHQWLMATYPDLHRVARREILPGGTLVYEWQGSDPSLDPLVLMAHQDVVPADEPQQWTEPPFAGIIRDNVIWGRGAIDDKGSLVAIMEAAQSLAAAGMRPARSLFLVAGHDEETGGDGAREAADLLRRRGVHPWLVLDEGSFAIRDYPVTKKPAALIGISEKGYLTLRLVAHGMGGHSSTPPDDSAVALLAKALTAVLGSPFPRHYRGPTRQMLDALAPAAPVTTRMAIANSWLFEGLLRGSIGASPPGAAMLHTTIAPTMLQGSSKENMLASTASALINFRIDPEDTTDSVLAHVHQALKDIKVDVTVVGRPQQPSPASPVDGSAYRFLAGVVRGQFDMPVVPAPVIAQTDSRSMRSIGDAIYRFQPLALTIADTDMLHGLNERIPVRDFAQMIAFYQTLIQSAAMRHDRR